jgi:hypothetical protein
MLAHTSLRDASLSFINSFEAGNAGENVLLDFVDAIELFAQFAEKFLVGAAAFGLVAFERRPEGFGLHQGDGGKRQGGGGEKKEKSEK